MNVYASLQRLPYAKPDLKDLGTPGSFADAFEAMRAKVDTEAVAPRRAAPAEPRELTEAE